MEILAPHKDLFARIKRDLAILKKGMLGATIGCVASLIIKAFA
jgi:hypothetical protein